MNRFCCFLLIACTGVLRAETPSFTKDVMPILSKAGCNTGLCHGNRNGKGDFKLSLRGESPARDFEALLAGKHPRVDPESPERSKMLLKPTLEHAHKGGLRFELDSDEYRVLLDWIRGGAKQDEKPAEVTRLEVAPSRQVVIAPDREVQLKVTAHFSDGEQRDVTRWAVYESSHPLINADKQGRVKSPEQTEVTIIARYLEGQVTSSLAFIPKREGFEWKGPKPANFIDEAVYANLKQLRMTPSEPCSDNLLVRRLYFDLCGRPPTAEEAQAFIEEPAVDKRARLVDDLLASEEFNDFWALKWADLLRVEEKVLDTKGVDAFHGWIRQAVAAGMPLNTMVAELLTSAGSTYEAPASNYYRALRKPVLRAEATAQLFLGVRMQCAQCHNHPFERLTQRDYFRFAAVFDGIEYDIKENKRRDKHDKNMFIGEQVVKQEGERKLKDPGTGKIAEPGLPGKHAPAVGKDPGRFGVLADWVVAQPQFAQVQANRIWFHLMGRGIVEPVDDFRSTNPPSNPALLELLAAELVEDGYDMRALIRSIVLSNTYRVSSHPNAWNADGESHFARARVRRLSAEQILNAMHQALDAPATYNGYPDGTKATQISGVNKVYRDKNPSPADRFLKLFGKPGRLTSSDQERTQETSLGQVFELTSGRLVDHLLAGGKRIPGLAESDKEVAVEALYWHCLGRPPAAAEREACLKSLEGGDRQEALRDIAWALVNAKEFLLRH